MRQFDAYEGLLDRRGFMADEVRNNTLHRICESGSCKRLASEEGALIYAHNEGHNAWLWMDKELAEERKQAYLLELIGDLKGADLPGVTGEMHAIERFARLYADANSVSYRTTMKMEAYHCPEVKLPPGVQGTMRPAVVGDAETVAEYLAGFSKDAFGLKVEPTSQIQAAEGMIASGNLYLWLSGSSPVSMANIAHRSPRHGRINAVYTPPAHHRQGYAGAIVASLCAMLESEGLVPMLYADTSNPASNKAYRNVGFVSCGIVEEIKFTPL